MDSHLHIRRGKVSWAVSGIRWLKNTSHVCVIDESLHRVVIYFKKNSTYEKMQDNKAVNS